MSMDKYDVIVAGAAVIDVSVATVDKDKMQSDRMPVNSVQMQTGGDATNEAIILSRLGMKTHFVSKIGNDLAGRQILSACRENGISTDSVKIEDGLATGINIVLIDGDGERSFITNESGSLRKFATEDIDFDNLPPAKVFSFASLFTYPLITLEKQEEIFRKVKEKGYILCTDTTKRKNNETIDDLRPMLKYVDYIFPNYDEAVLLTGKTDIDEIADEFLACGTKNIIIKTGKKGCVVKNKNERYELPALPGIQSIDSTGAGDTFAAAFMTALVEGKSLPDCALFANAAASVTVEHVGATEGIRTRSQVDERYRKIKEIV